MTLTPTDTTTTTVSSSPASDRRPWGSWTVLEEGQGYKVKRLDVSPHSRLSLQTHEHRSEQWLVVTGTATCTVGDYERIVTAGGHVSVPRGVAHRIANAQGEPLIIIEVQHGAYLGEDDIVRLEDDHGRV